MAKVRCRNKTRKERIVRTSVVQLTISQINELMQIAHQRPISRFPKRSIKNRHHWCLGRQIRLLLPIRFCWQQIRTGESRKITNASDRKIISGKEPNLTLPNQTSQTEVKKMNGKTVNPIRRKIGVRLAVVILRLELGVVIVLSQLCFDLPNRLSHYVQSRIDDQRLPVSHMGRL